MMIEEDRPGFPQTALVELDFEGRFDERMLNEAWHATVARHPLAGARVAGRGRRACWTPGLPSDVLWQDALVSQAAVGGGAAGLTDAGGVQLAVGQDHGAVHMRLGLHHAVCDGAGAFQILHDLLAAYANLCRGRDAGDGLPPVDAFRLASRHHFPYRRDGARRRIHDIYVGAREAAKFAVRSPVPLASTSDAAAVDASHVRATASAALSRELVAGLRKAAAAQGATVHDLLLRDGFLAARNWNAEHSRSHHPDEFYRILSPCNLRSRGHELTPAANLMSYAFYTRRARHCEEIASLTAGVVAESNYIRDENASMYFLRCLEAAHALPGVVRRLSRAAGCFATLVISNLGDPWRGSKLRGAQGLVEAGELRLRSMRAFSPIRSGTNAALVVCADGERATAGLSYNASCWDASAADAFLNMYLRQLAISAGTNLNSN